LVNPNPDQAKTDDLRFGEKFVQCGPMTFAGDRNLRFHSGLIVDEVVDMDDPGCLARDASVLAGAAIGARRLHAAVGRETYEFQPVSVTHSGPVIAAIPSFISINIDCHRAVRSPISLENYVGGVRRQNVAIDQAACTTNMVRH
jgi:hypothetical protein